MAGIILNKFKTMQRVNVVALCTIIYEWKLS